ERFVPAHVSLARPRRFVRTIAASACHRDLRAGDVLAPGVPAISSGLAVCCIAGRYRRGLRPAAISRIDKPGSPAENRPRCVMRRRARRRSHRASRSGSAGGPPMSYEPLVAITRGDLDESMHFGAIVVADADGRVLASAGDPRTVTYMRSTAKPLQAL